MQHWHSETEAPVDQVNRQLFALKNILERDPALAGALRFHARVALPFVSEAEWHQRGFDGLAATGNVACREGCTPGALRAWVDAAHARYPQQVLDETQWATLLQHLRRQAPVEADVRPPTRLVYSGTPPAADLIADRLGITLHSRTENPPSYTYVTATAAIAARRKREGFGLQHQVDPRPRQNDPNAGLPHLIFHHVLRILLDAPVLTRAEEQTLVARAAHTVAAGDVAAAAALRQDVFAWRDALRELDERGLDFRDGIPSEVAGRIVHPEVARVLADLQRAYRALQGQEQKQPFEAAARTFLEHSFRPTPLVIMEGFSRFTPLQRLFLDQSRRHGAEVVLVHPYSADQALGFDAIADTYADWWGQPPVTVVTPPFEGPPSLVFLKTHLFAQQDDPPPAPLEAVTAEAFAHRNREVAACVARVRDYLAEDREARDIAILSRDPAGYAPLLLEEAELQGVAELFNIPPRNLLLTPLGRFVLTLYDVWKNGSLDLPADAFETVLASGWLGSKAQASADAFAMAAPQLFARCRTFDDWTSALNFLGSTRLREDSRLPIASASEDEPQTWRDVLHQVATLCQRLFSAGSQSIGTHIQTLLDELERLNPERIREAERKVLARIEEVLTPLTDGASIEVTPDEFGAIIARLGYEEPDEAEEPVHQVAVTSPEGIDGTERPIVFYLGADDRRLPRGYTDPWPLYDDRLDAHRAQERYLFLAVARATTERLHLSYALVANREACRPSLYLEETSRLLGLPTHQDVVATGGDAAPEQHALAPPGMVTRPRYRLHEVAQFFLCPYRYHLERLDPKARRYHTAWQVPFVAKAAWLRYVLRFLHTHGVTEPDPAAFLQRALEAVTTTEPQMRRLFQGLRDLDWLAVRRNVEHELSWQMTTRFGNRPYAVSVSQAPIASYEIALGDRHVTVSAATPYAFDVGRFSYPYHTDTRDEEWLRYGSGDVGGPEPLQPSEDLGTVDVDGLPLFATLYDAMTWWNRGMTRAMWQELDLPDAGDRYHAFQDDLALRLPVLQVGQYPKHPGTHCFYCPVRSECLGLNP